MVNLKQIPVNTKKNYGRPRKDYDSSGKETITYKIITTPNEDYTILLNEYFLLTTPYKESQNEKFVGGMPVQMEKDCMSQLLRIGTNGELAYQITLKFD